jgi:hypothetical protein
LDHSTREGGVTLDVASNYFKCSDSERAAFEAGIKLGTIYHQFVGTPISSENVKALETAIEEGSKIQPFVENVSVVIDKATMRKKSSEYDYQTLTGNMLQVSLRIKYKDVTVICEMRNISEINYPLMYIKKVLKR